MAVVFLSSTLAELDEYRKAATSAIVGMGHRCVRMEEFNVLDRLTPSFRLNKVRECDLLVLLLDELYGPMIPGMSISYAEEEFNAAIASGKPRLACRLFPDALRKVRDAPDIRTIGALEVFHRQSKFVDRATDGLLPVLAYSPDQLRMWLAMQIAEHFRAPSTTLPVKPPATQILRNKAPTAGQIFISYASSDRPKITPLVTALERAGWSVWWDRTIPPGQVYDDVIEQALDRAECVIVVWSEQSVASQWVRNEAEEARNRGILVPVLLEEVKVPLAFRRIQAARLINWQGESDDPGFQDLCRAITRTVTNL